MSENKLISQSYELKCGECGSNCGLFELVIETNSEATVTQGMFIVCRDCLGEFEEKWEI